MPIFVNEAITNGIEAYNAKSQNQEFSLSHLFEYRVIETLIIIYGKINILNPYQIKDEISFKNNLMIYGASANDIEKFFSLLNDYNNWLNSNVSQNKNTIIKDIYIIIWKLIIKKNKVKPISNDEMNQYQALLGLKDNKIKQIAEMSANNINDILISKDIALKEIEEAEKPKEPLYLSEDEYEKYGIYPDDLKELSEDKIRQLNADITNLDESTTSGGRTKEDKPKKLVLTSGSGFIDGLVLLSIICTEIMVGIIITILIARLK